MAHLAKQKVQTDGEHDQVEALETTHFEASDTSFLQVTTVDGKWYHQSSYT